MARRGRPPKVNVRGDEAQVRVRGVFFAFKVVKSLVLVASTAPATLVGDEYKASIEEAREIVAEKLGII